MHTELSRKLDALNAKKKEVQASRAPKKRSKMKMLALFLGAVIACAGAPAAVVTWLHSAGAL